MTQEHEQFIWDKIIDIIAENPDVFPISKFIIDSNAKNNIDEKYIKFQLERFCNIQTTFQKYYQALSLFWYISDNSFKDSFNKLVISNVLFHYKEHTKDVDEKFNMIIDRL